MTWQVVLAGIAYGAVWFTAAYVGVSNFNRLWDDDE
jgi:hypothetical protein